ncbi:MAG: hypothetical protein MJ244_03815 [Clostridia bacterium]|nr:hypothetical protein [Clostridia bacterium]
MERDCYSKRREIVSINKELKKLEEEIAVLGKKSDIDIYFNLLARKKHLEKELGI